MAKKQSAASKKSRFAASSGPGFVFRGTVQSASAAASSGAKVPGAVVVRVDEVMAAPPALAHASGRDVLVVGGKGIRAGQQAVFEANSVSFGKDVTVRVSGVSPIGSRTSHGGITATRAAAAPLAAMTGAVVDPVQAHKDLLLKRSLDNADIVVAGTITEVRMAPETRAMATSAPAAMIGALGSAGRGVGPRGTTVKPQRLSEHDPIWHEAVVNVESVEKGATTQKQVTVRFPGSNDVRWRNHPKLRAGQQGVFLLSKGAAAGGPSGVAASMGGAARGPRLTTAPLPLGSSAMQANESQPISSIEKVRQLIGQPNIAAGAVRRTRTPTKTRRAGSRKAGKTTRVKARKTR